MRNNLIMHFHCSECGNRLELDYKPNAKPCGDRLGDMYKNKPEEPTGADCFYTPKISIIPCRKCIEKYTEPARKICEGISELSKVI